MLGEEIEEVMAPIALERGTIYWGGSGRHRLYYALPNGRQVWIEMGGAAEEWKSMVVGKPEKKQSWIRHDMIGGDSITIESPTWILPD